MALLLLAGCSDSGSNDGDDPSASDTPTGMPGAAPKEVTLAVAAVGAYPVNPAFDPRAASVPAGALVQVTFSNEDAAPIQHNWVVEGIANASSETIARGAQSTFDFTAPGAPGEFTFYCSIGDHRDRGMEGILTVTA